MIFRELTFGTRSPDRASRIPVVSMLLAAFLFVGCGYDSHEPSGSLLIAADGAPPALDAGTPESPPTGSGGDVGRPTFLGHDEAPVHAAVTAWRERHLIHGDVSSPDQAYCLDAFAELEVVTVSPEEFLRLCMRCEADDPAPECEEQGRANACAPVGRLRGPDGELGEAKMLIVVASAYPADSRVHENLVIHETIHHLGRCTGDGIDHPHTRTEYWCSGGDVCTPEEAAESINSRARLLLSDD